MSRAASLICLAWPLMFGLYPGRSTPSGQYQLIIWFDTSFGMSTRTGPGRPVVATWNASRITRGTSAASVMSQLCLVTGIVMPTVSHSWKASVPMTLYGTWPVTTTIGMLSMYASQSGVTMLVAAGPLVTMATPGRPVAWAYPSAMWPAPCSWRTRTWRIDESMSGS